MKCDVFFSLAFLAVLNHSVKKFHELAGANDCAERMKNVGEVTRGNLQWMNQRSLVILSNLERHKRKKMSFN